MKNNIDYDIKEKYAIHALEWCYVHFGICKRKKRNIILELNPKKKFKKRSVYFGNYCFYQNKLTIYLNNCETLLDIVQTVIHEYTHYLQSRTKYEYYLKVYSYSANPLEKEAKYNELKYGKKCLKSINNQFKISNSVISFK
jgi:Zn-dependent peptidase ImmA (M78 family)